MIGMIPFYAMQVLTTTGGDTTTVTSETIMDILKAVTSVFSVSQIVAMIAGLLGVSMTFVFLWWGVKKGGRIIISAVKTGKFKI